MPHIHRAKQSRAWQGVANDGKRLQHSMACVRFMAESLAFLKYVKEDEVLQLIQGIDTQVHIHQEACKTDLCGLLDADTWAEQVCCHELSCRPTTPTLRLDQQPRAQHQGSPNCESPLSCTTGLASLRARLFEGLGSRWAEEVTQHNTCKEGNVNTPMEK